MVDPSVHELSMGPGTFGGLRIFSTAAPYKAPNLHVASVSLGSVSLLEFRAEAGVENSGDMKSDAKSL
jgi:hypothetical protein